MSQGRCNTAILVSGSGTNLQAFIDRSQAGAISLDIGLVFSNRGNAFGLQRAKHSGLETACLEHTSFPDRESFDRAVAKLIDRREAQLLVLAGYMRILSPWFVQHFEGRILNIHPALLPAYPGLHTHERVLEAGETQHGSTVHFVNEALDAGPRVLQGRLTVDPNETAAELAERVQAIEHQIYPQAADWFATGRLRSRDGMAYLDGKPLHEPVIVDFPDRAG